MKSTHVGKLCGTADAFFKALFQAAKDLTRLAANDSVAKDCSKVFDAFRYDYDKFCRTLNPIAQLYTVDAYLRCLADHHDDTAFEKIVAR